MTWRVLQSDTVLTWHVLQSVVAVYAVSITWCHVMPWHEVHVWHDVTRFAVSMIWYLIVTWYLFHDVTCVTWRVRWRVRCLWDGMYCSLISHCIVHDATLAQTPHLRLTVDWCIHTGNMYTCEMECVALYYDLVWMRCSLIWHRNVLPSIMCVCVCVCVFVCVMMPNVLFSVVISHDSMTWHFHRRRVT